MSFSRPADYTWPKDPSQKNGYKVYKNVEAVIERWRIRENASALCFVDIVSDNKPQHITRAMISKSGTCPAHFNPENYNTGDIIDIELCQPSTGYEQTAMANFMWGVSKASDSQILELAPSNESTNESDSTTKVVITNVPKELKQSWEVYCKQQGLAPWRAFKDLISEKLMPF